MAGAGMGGAQPVVGWLLAALCGGTALYCLVRLCAPGRSGADRESDAAETLMGAGMAVMAVPGGAAAGVPLGLWVGVFGACAGWALLRGARRHAGTGPAHRGYHLVGNLAMVYMAVVMSRGAIPGMAGGVPAVTGALLVASGGYAVWAGVRPAAATGCGSGGGAGARLRGSCEVVMSLAMFCMLLSLG